MTASFNSVQLLLAQAICTLVLLCAPAEASAPRAAANGRVHTEVHTYFVSETEQDPAVWVHNSCHDKNRGRAAENEMLEGGGFQVRGKPDPRLVNQECS